MKNPHRLRFWPVVFAALAAALLFQLACGDDDDDDQPDAIAPEEAADPCAATVTAGDGAVQIRTTCGPALYFQTRVAIDEPEGVVWITSSDYPNEERTETRLAWSGLVCLPDAALDWTVDGSLVRLELTLSLPATCTEDVRIAGAEIASALPTTGGGLELATAGKPLHVLQQGYDSWSFAGVLRLTSADAPPLCDETTCPGGNNDDEGGETPGHSWWMAGLRAETGGPIVVAGALSAKTLKPRIGVYAHPGGLHGLRLIWGVTGESVPLAPGESITADPFAFVVSETEDGALSAYAQAAADQTPPLVFAGAEPRGWASWYDFFAKVDEGDVRANIEPTTDPLLAGLGLNSVQLDDGYMPAWGDWTTNGKFPAGLAGLAAEIRAWGLVPGIWMAPFLVDKKVSLVSEHPDWFLTDADGEPIVRKGMFNSPSYILDPTHPDAAAWLDEQVAGLVAAGYGYLKIDFLFAGAYEGNHYDPNATSLSAFEAGMQIIREAAGPDVYLLASGQPFLPTLGNAHAARTSTDIAASFPGRPLFFVTANVARSNAARYFADRVWFVNDPDNLLVRRPLTEREARVSLASNLLGGSAVFLGDDLTALPPDRWALLAHPAAAEMADAERQAVPLDLFDAPCDRIIRNVTTEAIRPKNRTPTTWLAEATDGAKLLAVFSFGEEPTVRYVDRTTLGLDPSRSYRVTDLFAGDTQTWDGGPLEVVAPKSDVTVVRVEAIE